MIESMLLGQNSPDPIIIYKQGWGWGVELIIAGMRVVNVNHYTMGYTMAYLTKGDAGKFNFTTLPLLHGATGSLQ